MSIDTVYIAGFGRSGSTLLEAMMRKHFDVLGVGELFFIWDRGFLKNENVGNGVPFRDSPFWQSVLAEAYGTVSEAQAREFDAIFQSLRGRKMTRRPLFASLPADLSEFRDVAAPLYAALRNKAAGRVIVDGSKYPLFGAALVQAKIASVGVIQMYRDPRAVAYSWAKVKRRAEGGAGQEYMARSKLSLSSVWRWKWFNHQAAQLASHPDVPATLVGYERFCAAPDAYMALLAQRFGLGAKKLPDMEWESVSGNPARLDGTLGKIVLDEKWREAMAWHSKLIVGGACMAQYRALQSREAAQSRGGADV